MRKLLKRIRNYERRIDCQMCGRQDTVRFKPFGTKRQLIHCDHCDLPVEVFRGLPGRA